jgi:hypothetical protein
MATTRPTLRRGPRCGGSPEVSGHGASSSTVTSEAALLSANLIRTPSQTRKYGAIGDNHVGIHLTVSFVNPLSAV